jgi:hypothetical protein
VATPKGEENRRIRNRSKKEEKKVMCGHLSSKYSTAKLALIRKIIFLLKDPSFYLPFSTFQLSLFAFPWTILIFDLSWAPLKGITDNVRN